MPQCCAGQKISKGKQWSQEKWIEKAREVHGDLYDYSLVDYQGSWKEVRIICSIHSVFPQKAAVHSTMERGCPKCGRIKQAASQTYTQEDFLRLAQAVHGDKYDYSETEYKPRIGGKQEDVTIICRKHGPFPQKAHTHLNGAGCPECKQELLKEIFTKSLEQFIADARKIHGDRYDYSKVEYKGAHQKVQIFCSDHGSFEQTPDTHINPPASGCPRCNESKGEKGVAEFLDSIEVEFETQKRFPDCKHKRRLPFDFYLPDYDALIEFDGQQHFEPNYSWIKDPVKGNAGGGPSVSVGEEIRRLCGFSLGSLAWCRRRRP